MRRLALLLTAAVIAAPAASDKKPKTLGAFTPVIAKQRLTYSSEQLNGKERMLAMFEGTYLRASNGSELATLGPVIHGKVMPPTEGRLRIARDGSTFKLDFMAKTATLVAMQSTPLSPHVFPAMKEEKPKNAAPKPGKTAKGKNAASSAPDTLEENIGDFAGFEIIGGFKCAGLVIRDHGYQTATAWRELKHDLLLRRETIFGSNDDHVLVALERFDVDLKQEPEASFFEVPAKWTVIENAPTPKPAAPKP